MSDSMRRIFIWKGYHDQTMFDFFKLCWDKNYLLVCCPPNLKDFSFIDSLPEGDISLCGQWPDTKPLIKAASKKTAYPETPILGVFTTGTSREKPRLVLYSKTNITSCHNAIFSLFDISRIRQVYCYPQPYHVFGILLGYAACHLKKWRLVVPEGRYNADHHRYFTEKVSSETISLFTPTHLNDLSRYLVTNKIKPTKSYSCIIGGAKVMTSDWHNAKTIANIDQPSIGYGCTEASPGISHLAPGVKPTQDGEVGSTLPSVNLELFGKKGLEFSGPSLAMATIESGKVSFLKKMKLNDQLSRRNNGSMVFNTRTDNILNRGGEKFALEEIESFIKMSHKVESICVPVTHSRLGLELGVVIQSSSKLKKATLYKSLESKFGKKFSVQNYIETDQLPVNDQAKLDRKAAKAMFKQNKT